MDRLPTRSAARGEHGPGPLDAEESRRKGSFATQPTAPPPPPSPPPPRRRGRRLLARGLGSRRAATPHGPPPPPPSAPPSRRSRRSFSRDRRPWPASASPRVVLGGTPGAAKEGLAGRIHATVRARGRLVALATKTGAVDLRPAVTPGRDHRLEPGAERPDGLWRLRVSRVSAWQISGPGRPGRCGPQGAGEGEDGRARPPRRGPGAPRPRRRPPEAQGVLARLPSQPPPPPPRRSPGPERTHPNATTPFTAGSEPMEGDPNGKTPFGPAPDFSAPRPPPSFLLLFLS